MVIDAWSRLLLVLLFFLAVPTNDGYVRNQKGIIINLKVVVMPDIIMRVNSRFLTAVYSWLIKRQGQDEHMEWSEECAWTLSSLNDWKSREIIIHYYSRHIVYTYFLPLLLPSHCNHVIVIVRENRAHDQVSCGVDYHNFIVFSLILIFAQFILHRYFFFFFAIINKRQNLNIHIKQFVLHNH